MLKNNKGVSLIEILIGMVIITIVSIATLSYFSYGIGGIGKQGNRRAAMERTRARVEALMAADVDQIEPPVDGQTYWLTCTGSPCTWTVAGSIATEAVSVDDLANQRMETTVRWIDDPAAGTAVPNDVLEFGVKVWFMPNADDDDFNRVHVRTLRTP